MGHLSLEERKKLKKRWPTGISWVWKHACLFTFQEEKGGNAEYICCLHCGKVYEYDSSTSTIAEHLSREHLLIDLTEILAPNDEQPNLDSFIKRKSYSRSDEQLCRFIAESGFPLRLVSIPSFQSYSESLNPVYRVPDVRTIKKQIQAKKKELDANVC